MQFGCKQDKCYHSVQAQARKNVSQAPSCKLFTAVWGPGRSKLRNLQVAADRDCKSRCRQEITRSGLLLKRIELCNPAQ